MGSAEWAPKRFHNGTRSFLPPSLQLISEQTQALLSSPRYTPYSPRGLFPGLIGSISYHTIFQVHCFIQTFVSSHSSWNPYLVLEKVNLSVKQKPPPFDFFVLQKLVGVQPPFPSLFLKKRRSFLRHPHLSRHTHSAMDFWELQLS